MRPALVATDLDGTIVRRDGSVSPRTIDALKAAAESGVLVVLVTGRPPRWLWPIRDQLGVTGAAICANGALTVDLGTSSIVTRRSFRPGEVARIGSALRELYDGQGAFAIETGDLFAREPGYQPRMFGVPDCPVDSLEALMADDPPVVKLLWRVNDVPADDLLAAATAVIGQAAAATHSGSHGSLLEIGPPGVTKATSLAALAAAADIPAQQCIAFGDMPNDIPMLHWAGAGYAMSDGHPDALAVADHHAPPCAEDGVAQILESLI